jgi:hypothetical protein
MSGVAVAQHGMLLVQKDTLIERVLHEAALNERQRSQAWSSRWTIAWVLGTE